MLPVIAPPPQAHGGPARRTSRWLLLVLLGIFALLSAGCRPTPTPLQTATAPAENTAAAAPTSTLPGVDSTETPAPSVTRQPEASPSLTPQPTIVTPTACLQDRGRIESHSLDSPWLEEPLEVRIYTPPCYDQWAEYRYPVLYFFHGANNTVEQMARLGVGEAADELIRSGEIAPLLIVMPQETQFIRPSRTGFDEAVLETLRPWLNERYRTLTDRQHQAVGGLSRGGAWAVHFGLHYWEDFGSLGAHSAAAFLEDAKILEGWLDEIPPNELPRIYMDIGDRDDLQDENGWLAGTLNAYNVPHELHVFPGMHDESYWAAHLAEYLRWYDAGW